MDSADPLITVLNEWMEVFHSRTSHRMFRFAKEKGLSMSQLGALFRLHHTGGSGVTDLGEELGVTSAAVSQMLERLVQHDLILRTEDPSDRRAKQLVLTEKGKQVIQESYLVRRDWLDDLASALSADEKALVAAALTTLIEKAKLLETPVDVEN